MNKLVRKSTLPEVNVRLVTTASSPSVIVLESENGKQRDTASKESEAKEKESDRLRKKGCTQGESNGDSHDTSLTF